MRARCYVEGHLRSQDHRIQRGSNRRRLKSGAEYRHEVVSPRRAEIFALPNFLHSFPF
jgi:hypothetical protein